MVWMGVGQSTPNISTGLIQNSDSDLIEGILKNHETYYTTPPRRNISNQTLENTSIQNVCGSSMKMESAEVLQYVDMKHNEANDSLILQMYQSDTDPSVVSIQKDGIGVCEKCGRVGAKHVFYAKERRFCSIACARSYCSSMSESNSLQNLSETKHCAEHAFKMETHDDYEDLILERPLPQLPAPSQTPIIDDCDLEITPRKLPESTKSYSWEQQLLQTDFVAAPVSSFKNDPLRTIWHHIKIDMKVEVETTDKISDFFTETFWVATVKKIVGYMALLRYEGFADDDSKDFWVSLCSNKIHPIGWCAIMGKPLMPPNAIKDKSNDWRGFLKKRLVGARTLPLNHINKVFESSKSRFRCDLNLEVVDKNNISQVKLAVIQKTIGKRLNVKYFDTPEGDVGFWCHEDSPLLHPVGWAKKVDHHISAPKNYLDRVNRGVYDSDDATCGLFTSIQRGSNSATTEGLCVGMKLEAIDPFNLTSICVASIVRLLNCGYVMIRIETSDADADESDWFCCHIRSPCIFPAGFCERNGIPLTPPRGYDPERFSWEDYLAETNTEVVDEIYFNRHIPDHGFVAGMKVEAADLVDPQLVCVATITKVVGRLLLVHFDGWKEDYDQWVDCESPDIYPVGWCQSMNHKLEGPPTEDSKKPTVVTPKDSRGKNSKGKKKKFGYNPPRNANSHSNTSDSGSNTKIIPRLVDNAKTREVNELCPNDWDESDVVQFLQLNDCANYCEAFNKKKVDGKALLNLSRDDIVKLVGGKIGPSLKIQNLIQKLKIRSFIAAPFERE